MPALTEIDEQFKLHPRIADGAIPARESNIPACSGSLDNKSTINFPTVFSKLGFVISSLPRFVTQPTVEMPLKPPA